MFSENGVIIWSVAFFCNNDCAVAIQDRKLKMQIKTKPIAKREMALKQQ